MILHTRWNVNKVTPKKEEPKKIPEKKKIVEPKVEVAKKEAPAVIEDPTVEDFIATLPKKKREVKKIITEE